MRGINIGREGQRERERVGWRDILWKRKRGRKRKSERVRGRGREGGIVRE